MAYQRSGRSSCDALLSVFVLFFSGAADSGALGERACVVCASVCCYGIVLGSSPRWSRGTAFPLMKVEPHFLSSLGANADVWPWAGEQSERA